MVIRYLLDEHVQVLWDLGCEACRTITPSVYDRAEAYLYSRQCVFESMYPSFASHLGLNLRLLFACSNRVYHTIPFQYPQDLVASHDLDLRDTMAVPQHDTNLRRRGALLRELADLVDDLLGRGLQPGGRGARVGDGGGADALAVAVHATHDGGGGCVVGGEGVWVLALRCAEAGAAFEARCEFRTSPRHRS